jgi:hypothetical protein
MLKTPVWVSGFVLTLLVTLVVMLFGLTLGLIVAEFIIFPLALILAALAAALSAGWVGTLWARDGTRSRLLSVIGLTELVALILAVLVLVGLRSLLLGPVFWIGVVSSVILSLSAMGAMGRFREPAGQEHHDLRLTIGLAVAALVSIPLVIWLADLAGLAGA